MIEDDFDWRDRFAMWRMRWFPYRTYEWTPRDGFGPAIWEWHVLRRWRRAH